jgi:hypothetical protein
MGTLRTSRLDGACARAQSFTSGPQVVLTAAMYLPMFRLGAVV